MGTSPGKNTHFYRLLPSCIVVRALSITACRYIIQSMAITICKFSGYPSQVMVIFEKHESHKNVLSMTNIFLYGNLVYTASQLKPGWSKQWNFFREKTFQKELLLQHQNKLFILFHVFQFVCQAHGNAFEIFQAAAKSYKNFPCRVTEFSVVYFNIH